MGSNKFEGCVSLIVILALLIAAGVAWLQNNYGSEITGIVLVAVGVFCVLGLGAIFTLTVIQMFGNIMVGHKKASSRTDAYEARHNLEVTRQEARFQQAVMRQAQFLGRHIGANYKAQIAAQYKQEALPEPEDEDPYVDLEKGHGYTYDDDQW